MNLHRKLLEREAGGNRLRVGVIGAGKFGTMYLSQARRTPGIHLVGLVDLSPARAREALAATGWPAERYGAPSLAEAARTGATFVGDDADALIDSAHVDIIVEVTGNPPAAVRHMLRAFAAGKHVVNVTVEADAFCGPLLARRAAEAGVVYSLAYGDQPALICDLVDWARTAGLDVVCAGRGHKWLPHFADSTPDTVWEHYGLSAEQARLGGLNPQMFNSFLDGSKPAIESAAVCNATGLIPPPHGLEYPPSSLTTIPHVCRPRREGGQLHAKGQVEVLSSLERDGRPIDDNIRWGVFVVFEGDTDYVRRCFGEYGMITDPSGRYGALYKRWHLIGLELGISVAAVGLRGEATGTATGHRADAIAMAKRDLKPGEMLDGEGGYTVVGTLMPAQASLAMRAFPLGLAHKVKLLRPVAKGMALSWDDVEVDEGAEAVTLRREMESLFAEPASAG
ncbi:NAD(P)H-dependent oxidoreductase [Ancylobacter terrae]|uniref:NAD(P)H-dependent oxidoreductase n=1 Tax=Ancylobacter sp. sgz301288 TaxID=3342077 RepID=UPI00385F0D73